MADIEKKVHNWASKFCFVRSTKKYGVPLIPGDGDVNRTPSLNSNNITFFNSLKCLELNVARFINYSVVRHYLTG